MSSTVFLNRIHQLALVLHVSQWSDPSESVHRNGAGSGRYGMNTTGVALVKLRSSFFDVLHRTGNEFALMGTLQISCGAKAPLIHSNMCKCKSVSTSANT
ncbi:hypothetical protein CVT25_014755 [Psilocybe cyanescens]|uniref:Uncharacterized protein n=1 Tax=Psilocybe cyanescens TaxID=93625 RepID=A0A409X8Z5_PSICY|nr:hypothetical protein CVT25_014755 [Psilocybe cyanescens]